MFKNSSLCAVTSYSSTKHPLHSKALITTTIKTNPKTSAPTFDKAENTTSRSALQLQEVLYSSIGVIHTNNTHGSTEQRTREVLRTSSFFAVMPYSIQKQRLIKLNWVNYTTFGVLSTAMNLKYITRTGKNKSQVFTNEYPQRIKNKPSANSGIRGCHAVCRVNRRRRTETSASVNLAHSVTSQNAGNLKPRAISKLRTSDSNVGICFFFGNVYRTHHPLHAPI